jgi:hypothetical protein
MSAAEIESLRRRLSSLRLLEHQADAHAGALLLMFERTPKSSAPGRQR